MLFDKEKPHKSEITFRDELVLTDGKVVIMADDVLNTGRTLAFALQPFLATSLEKTTGRRNRGPRPPQLSRLG